MQAPMISTPLKQTNEIDWIVPLKSYIRGHYGDDPEKYSEECSTLNRLRQDMRGAAKDSAAGRDLLYRYYGQLELLDLRFPVDENHIKISFTWLDAFTLRPTAQHSLAYEKASIIFNIAAVLSCYAVAQTRSEDTGLKTAYHSFQAAAGMFAYINDNFLHAPSTDLNNETVRTLIALMLAQAQEVFLEKQVADSKKFGLLAKLASQSAYLYSQSIEGMQENVNKGVFERVWLLLTQVKAAHMSSIAQYYQAIADNDANAHGVAIARLQSAEKQSKEVTRLSNAFPNNLPPISNLGSETGAALIENAKRHVANIQEKLSEFIKDNDFIYHQPVPNEAGLAAIPKLPAAKAITVSELYQGQDIQRIIGPDIFQKIVPMSVTESASLYDEEKAKLIRAEAERVETANSEMAASLDYLKLPDSLSMLKGGMNQEITVDNEFRTWCQELAGHAPFSEAFDELAADKSKVVDLLDISSRKLDEEESVCEKMRSRYGADWVQLPSSRLTATLRTNVRNYRTAILEASTSDTQLRNNFKQNESDFDEMRSAGEADEADILYQRAMIKAGAARGKNNLTGRQSTSMDGDLLGESFEEGCTSVSEQIANVEELMHKLSLIKRERTQVLKDLKEKIHNDDISQVLILNKKSITNQESQLFKAELEKFRPHQMRLMQANHKQASLMKELTRAYSDLLQDKRVKSEQARYESLSRQRNTVMTKYRKVVQAYNDLTTGLERAQSFYSEMKASVESLAQNIDSFVRNRRSEGGELLGSIERRKPSAESDQADLERDRLQELMGRMNMETQPPQQVQSQLKQGLRPIPLHQNSMQKPTYNPAMAPPVAGVHPNARSPPPITSSTYIQSSQRQGHQIHVSQGSSYQQAGGVRRETQSPFYDPTTYGPISPPISPPMHKTMQPQHSSLQSPQAQQVPQHQGQYASQGYMPPPPPPGPPPNQPADPWAGLSGWR